MRHPTTTVQRGARLLHEIVPFRARVRGVHRVVLPTPFQPVRLHLLLGDVHLVVHVVPAFAIALPSVAVVVVVAFFQPRVFLPQRLHELLRVQRDVLLDVAAPHVLLRLERVLLLLLLLSARRGGGGGGGFLLLLLFFLRVHRRLSRREVVLHEIRARVRGFDPSNPGAVRVLRERPAARVPPLPRVPVRPPHALVVLLVDVLLVARLEHHPLAPLHEPSRAVVLHVLLRLSEK
mmetsp:Transcript_5389/g.19459  ORF Transcript_5389/g.19459 Transcript_5389/m.19459 type:complete len:234 (+) Transcript_5389:1414-2115(+)